MTIKSGDVSRDSTRTFCQGFLKNKRAQVTIFIIIGIVILFAFAGIMYFTKTFTKQDILAAEEPVLSEVPQEFKPLQTFTDSCLNQIGKKGLLILGEQGGYIHPDLMGEYSAINPTEADGIDLEPLKVPYWYYNNNPNEANAVTFSSLRPELYAAEDSEMSIESQLARYVKESLNECLIDYETFSEQGFEVQNLDKDTKEVIVSVGEESVNFWLKMRVKGTKGESEHQIDQFYVKIPLKLKHYYQVATDISNAQRNHTFLENLALELIQIYGHVDSSKIPPTSAVTFEEFSLTYWTDVDVKEKFKSLLTTHVPMLRHLSSNNFYRYEYPVTDLSGLYQKTYDNMIIPLENAEGTEVSFDYFGWEPYVDINEGETKIKPAQTSVTSPLGVIPFSFTFQRYYTQYDVSFPVMVTVADQTAFAGEGYSLSFALEGTIINNAVPDENFAIKEEFTALKDSMLCDEQHLDTELIKTVVIDSYNQEPLELVQIGFSVPSQDNCIIGVTDDSGELETNYPPAYGGVVEFVKDEYLTNFYPIDTYEYTENPGIIGYAVAGYPQEVIELHKIVEVPVSAKKYEFSKCITHENGNDKYCLYNFGDALFEPNLIGPLATVYANGSKSWKHEFYLSDSPQQLGENETVTYTLIRRADLNPNVISEEYSTSFRVEGNQTTTIQLVPGIYEVTAAVITENAFNIPKNDRCEDSNCATISGMNITSFVTGVVNLDVETFYMEITPEDLYSAQEIEFYVFNYDLHKLGLRGEVANNVPALVLEDMMLISEMDQIGKNPLVRGLLEPVYK